MNSLLRCSMKASSPCLQQRSSFMKAMVFPNISHQMSFYHNNISLLNQSKQGIKIGGEEITNVEEMNTAAAAAEEVPIAEETTITDEFTSSGPIRLSNIVGGEGDAKFETYVSPSFTNLPMDKVRELKFAVIQVGGHQYKVTNGDRITVNRIPVEVGTQINLNKILLVGGKDFTVVGRPIVGNASVLATVEQHTRAAYTIAFKKRRRKNSKRFKGHQQQISTLCIDDVQFIDESAKNAELSVVCYE